MKKIGGKKMENVKGKIFTGIAIVIVVLVLCIVYWLLFYQNSTYYTKIDNTKVEVLSSSEMKYQYTLDAYDENGKIKKIVFKTRRELKDGAYLLLEVMLTRGVKSWKEVPFNNLPDKVQDKYE